MSHTKRAVVILLLALVLAIGGAKSSLACDGTGGGCPCPTC